LNEDVSYLTSELLSLQKEVEISSALLTWFGKFTSSSNNGNRRIKTKNYLLSSLK
jgi:hypothetical protein